MILFLVIHIFFQNLENYMKQNMILIMQKGVIKNMNWHYKENTRCWENSLMYC